VVARFATFNEEDARFFHDVLAAALKELRAEAGIAEEEEEGDANEEEEDGEQAAPAPTCNGE